MKVTTDACLFGAWVATSINDLKKTEHRILDIGTGTGLLTLMLAQKIPNIKLDAVEIDKNSFIQASENIAATPWHDSIEVIHSDANEFSPSAPYDIILSNPPFYENELKAQDDRKNIAHHNKGLVLPHVLQIIKKNLKPTGHFFLLLPYKRNEEIKRLLSKNEFAILKMILVRQTLEHDFFRILLMGKLNADNIKETELGEISIKDEKDQYTPAFINLLKDYYLNF